MAYFFIIIFIFFSCNPVFAEPKSEWIHVKASDVGTDFNEMKMNAINIARSDALQQAGIQLNVSTLSIKGESKRGVTDFFSYFSESSTRGLILDEKNFIFTDPIRVKFSTNQEKILYQIDVELDILVAVIIGERDSGFEVKISSDKTTYHENESVKLHIRSTRNGYLTIFNISNDSLSVVFPNVISKNNHILANEAYTFPPTDIYDLELLLNNNQEKTTNELFVAVVTKEEIPFLSLEDNENLKNSIELRQNLLTNYSKWLYKIPMNIRSSDSIILQVVSSK